MHHSANDDANTNISDFYACALLLLLVVRGAYRSQLHSGLDYFVID